MRKSLLWLGLAVAAMALLLRWGQPQRGAASPASPSRAGAAAASATPASPVPEATRASATAASPSPGAASGKSPSPAVVASTAAPSSARVREAPHPREPEDLGPISLDDLKRRACGADSVYLWQNPADGYRRLAGAPNDVLGLLELKDHRQYRDSCGCLADYSLEFRRGAKVLVTMYVIQGCELDWDGMEGHTLLSDASAVRLERRMKDLGLELPY